MTTTDRQSTLRVRPSRYNSTIHRNGVKTGIFNAATGEYVRLSDLNRSILLSKGPVEIDTIDFESELRAGLLVASSVDEVTALRFASEVSRASRGAPLLTIAPTLDCNFGCNYCFESHRKGQMSEEVQDQLVVFIETVMLEGLSYMPPLTISWFGGEPLMAMAAIRRLTWRFLALQSTGKISKYTASMVTNGYMLTSGRFDQLRGVGIKELQVTVDGPRSVHNARRHLKGRKTATFDTIVNNLASAPQDVSVLVRMNADRRNLATFDQLMEQLDDVGLLERVTVDVARVEPFREHEMADATHIIPPQEFAEWQTDAIEKAEKAGWPLLRPAPRPRIFGSCQVDEPNAFVVGPTGELMKCWAELGNDPEVVGHLLDPDTWSHLRPSRLENRDPFDDDDCVNCPVMPLCMGGCPILRDGHRRDGKKVCPPIKYNLNEQVLRVHEDGLCEAISACGGSS